MRPHDLDVWAKRADVTDLLKLPASVLTDRALQDWMSYNVHHGWTLARLICATPSRYESAYSSPWSREPPLKAIESSIAWIIAAANATARAVVRTPATAADARLAPVAARLDLEIKTFSKQVGPPIATPDFKVALKGPDVVLSLSPEGPMGCNPYNEHFGLNLEASAGASMVYCGCSAPPAACRARLHALQWVRARLGEAQWAPGETIAERVGMPPWQRTIAMLGANVRKEPDGELGWGIDLRRDLEIKALLCRPAKNGTVKTVYLNKQDVAGQLTRPDLLAADKLLLQLLPSLTGPTVDVAMFFLAGQALVGHPRVFDAQTRAPYVVRFEPIIVALQRREAEVGVRFQLGKVSYTAKEFNSLVDGGRNHRVIRVGDGELLLSEASAATCELAAVLSLRGDTFALDAVPGLLRHAASIKLGVDVDPALGVLRRKGEVRPVVRIEAGMSPLLRVQIRSRPHPTVGLSRPGEADSGLVGREDTTYVLVDRDPDGELVAAEMLVTRLGLPADPEWAWAVDDPERAIDLVAALRDSPDAIVEWGGRRPEVRSASGKNVSVEIGRGTDWFGLGGTLNVDGAQVPLTALLEAMRSGRSWVRAEGEVWVRVEEQLRERLRALADAADAKGRIAPIHAGAIQALEDEGVTIEASAIWVKGMDRMRAAAHLSPRVPKGLKAELRPYQVEGYAWMTRLLHWAGGAVLADDMGLGKTVQALAVMLDRAASGPQLVVAPMSVGFNWLREAERFAPSLRAHLHHGTSRPQDLAHLGPQDVVITTWDILFRDEALHALTWTTVVFDEAQAMKNADTQRAKAAGALKADARIALTGTPVENRLSELWSLFDVIVPGLFGTATSFRARFANPIERDQDPERRQALARTVRPFLLRRMKSQVATDLPPRTEIRVDVELGPEERRRYDSLRLATIQALADDTGPKEQARFRVLAALTRLRQIACASRLVDESAPPRSAKIDRLLEMLIELREEGRRVLVFSQFAELIRHVRPLVEAEGLRVCHLDGSTPAAQRRAQVDIFQAGGADVFLISLKAGGTGLNLTAASEVILLDPWWNPAVEDQAADRTHRIGQVQAVTVYRLVARNTVEDGILALHSRKRDLAGAVLAGTGDAGALSVEDLVALMSGEEKPAGKAKAAKGPKALTGAKAAKAVGEVDAGAKAVGDLDGFEEMLRGRLEAGEISRTVFSNTIKPLRRLAAWAGTLNNVEDRLSEWSEAGLDIPKSDDKLVPTALRKLRAWEAGE